MDSVALAVTILAAICAIPAAKASATEPSIPYISLLVILCLLALILNLRNTSFGSYVSSGISSSSSQSSGSVEIKSRKVNESLHELHKPSARPRIQIVLFHGLQPGDYSEAHLRTWQSEDGYCIWPQTWLVDAVPGAHVLSVSYNGGLAKTSDKHREGDIYIITENLLSDLLEGKIGQEDCPVILVGHSIGGLVIKHLCNRAHLLVNQKEGREKAKLQIFLNNIKGIFYYATPHHGTSIPKEWEKELPCALVTYFKTLSTDTARLNYEFGNWKTNWKFLSLGEGRPTNAGWLRGFFTSVFVPEASAREGDFNLVNDADHFSICKPSDKHSRRFSKLRDFALNTAEAADKEHEAIRVQEEEARVREDVQHVPKHVKGVDSQVQDIRRKLESTKVVGLVGMGGLGKTTLAKAVFNRLAADFEYTCFIPNVKHIDGDECQVFDKITEAMHFHGKKAQHEGQEKWKTKPLLLVLDDILGERDLKVLSQIDETTVIESRIIFTARESPWLAADKVYRVDVLDKASADQLFRSYAFPDNKTPSPKLEGLLTDIVKKCEGLPLALEVLGQFLGTTQKYEIWKETLDGMPTAEVESDVNKRLWAKLKLSYDGLEEKLQQMFLDATTVFNRGDWKLRHVKAAWQAMYNTKNVNLLWKKLVDMSLVYDVGDYDDIYVHEQLQSLGRKIARDSGKWSESEGLTLLRNTMDLQQREIVAIWIRPPYVAHTTIEGLGSNIVILDVKCEGLQSLPESFGNLSTLQYLDLNGCEGLQSLPESFGNLCTLQHLDLCGCKGLQSLPECFGNLSTLQHLDLLGCKGLQSLPESFGNLCTLQHLDLCGCKGLQSLPECFGNLSTLQHLDLLGCKGLQSLPESFGNLSTLQHLDLSYCVGLQSLPESFGNLSTLQHLDLSYCVGLQSLPESFGNLSTLQYLGLDHCKGLQSLLESFGNLSTLQHLDLRRCEGLQSLLESFGKLSTLQHLDLDGCEGLQSLPESFGNLCTLQHLDLCGCKGLQSLPECFGNLSTLQHLDLLGCKGLQSLPESFGNLSTLQHLDLSYCVGLQSLPQSFGNLSTLQHLDLYDCEGLQSLPESFGNLSTLQHLDLLGCKGLQSLPESFGNLSTLQHLDLYGCKGLRSLPESFGNLSTLHHLDVRDCDGTMLEYVRNFSTLQINSFLH